MQLLHTPKQAAAWLRSHVTGNLQTDSRKVQPGDGFLAWPGAATDARAHVAQALASGAVACLMEHSGSTDFSLDGSDVRLVTYVDLKTHSAAIASAYFCTPSDGLAVLAVTGTNGKTSTAWWLAQALSHLELVAPVPCAFVGTLGMGVPPNVISTGLTTPDPVALQAALRGFVTDGLGACAIEASSIGIEEHRLDATRIHTAIFTNLTQDHLDYHGDMLAYGQSKAKLLNWPGLRAAVINIDDPFGAELAAQLSSGGESALDLWTVSMQGRAGQTVRLSAQAIVHTSQGVRMTVVEGAQRIDLITALMGDYNVSNLLGVIAAMRTLGVPLAAAVQACSHLTPVPGRMECVSVVNQPLVAVDYAHTPDALAKALDALRPVSAQRGGRLWCVFGCGGDRDTTKRPLMGAVAAAHADRVVVTSDNPRSEAMEAIISQILLGLEGVAGVIVEPDRAWAIAQTLGLAAPADVVLVAGKGHEDYQEIKGKRWPFSDLAQVNRALLQPSSTPTMMTCQQLAAWLDLAQLVGLGAVEHNTITRIYTDSRSIEPGDVFVALQGERFDANDYLAQAKERGAVAAICQGLNAAEKLRQAGLPGLVVRDTKLALAQLATHWRAQFKLPLIAVTGSNGKTTVTQMIASILRAYKPQAMLATQGNLNNDIGVPLTVLGLRAHHQLAVVELGMNHPGEIATLAAIAQPTVALVNNAQREHLEFMETVEAVARENGSVIEALPSDGVAVFPVGDTYSVLWDRMAGQRSSLQFGAEGNSSLKSGATVYATQAIWSDAAWQVDAQSPLGALHYSLHIAGRHNVKNSLAAVACALAAGVPLAAIAAGLDAFEPVKGRSRALQITLQASTITVVDDTYNANPDSVRAAIEVLAALPGPRLLVLGDMGEVGNQGPQFHAEALQLARSKNIEKVLVTGAASAQAAIDFDGVEVHPLMADLQAAVLVALPGVASVLVKGSRFMKMEQVVQNIVQHGEINCTLTPINQVEHTPC
jgi:murE/murF fusion protein